MTRFLPTLLALAVLAGLGYYVYKYEQEPLADKSIPKVAVTDRASITRVELEDTAKKAAVVLEKGKDDKWQVTAPLKAKPDDEKVDSLLTRLEKVKADRIVGGDAGQKPDLKEYGLDAPSHKVTWKAGDKSSTLLIGKESPLGSNSYVKLADDDKVFLVNSGDLEILKKDLYTFRDKTVLKADKEQIKQLTVTKADGETWKFTQGADSAWNIEEPFKAPGDPQVTGDMAADLGRLRAEEFTAETTADLKPYGLDKPQHTVQLVLKEDGATKTVLFGDRKKTDSSRVYAKRDNEPNVYLVDSALIKALGNKIDDFRDKTVFRTADREIAAVTVEKQGGEPVKATRAADGKWSYENARLTTEPGSAGTALLEKLRDLKAARFVQPKDVKPAEFGVDKPDFTLRLSMAAKAPTTPTTGAKAEPPVEVVAKVGKPVEGGRYVQLEGDPVVVVTKEDFSAALEQFVKTYREIYPVEEWNLKSVEISTKDRKETYEINDKGDWAKQGQKEGVAGLKEKVRAFVSTLPHLAATGWQSESKDALKQSGLEEPAVTVVVKTKDGKPDTTLKLAAASGKHFVKIEGKPGIGEIGPEPLARATEALAADTGQASAPATPATTASTAPAAPATATTATTK